MNATLRAPTVRPLRFRTRRVRTLADRVKAMRDLVLGGLRDPEMRQVALAVAAGDRWTLAAFARKHDMRPLALGDLVECRGRDEDCELGNFYGFVRANVRYTGDIATVDTYVSARRTIFEMRAGDCDDHFIALATLAVQNGYGVVARCVAVLGAQTARGEPIIGHIYAVLLVPKFRPRDGVALDSTLPRGVPGEEARHASRVDFRIF